MQSVQLQMPHQQQSDNPSCQNLIPHAVPLVIKLIGCVIFIGLLLFMAGVELNPGPVYENIRRGIVQDDQMKLSPQPNPQILHGDIIGTHSRQAFSNDNPVFEKDDSETEYPYISVLQISNQTVSSPNTVPLPPVALREKHLVEFAEYITYDNQERIAIMLGFDLDRVEVLRCKHRENVTGVSLDLLLDWMKCNPQRNNRSVSNAN